MVKMEDGYTIEKVNEDENDKWNKKYIPINYNFMCKS